jgi:hypothetical protein
MFYFLLRIRSFYYVDDYYIYFLQEYIILSHKTLIMIKFLLKMLDQEKIKYVINLKKLILLKKYFLFR